MSTPTRERFQAGLAPVQEDELTIDKETVTTFVVKDKGGKEVSQGTIGTTDGIMIVKLTTGQTMRLSSQQMDALVMLRTEWRREQQA